VIRAALQSAGGRSSARFQLRRTGNEGNWQLDLPLDRFDELASPDNVELSS
jgi:hypothetical protein